MSKFIAVITIFTAIYLTVVSCQQAPVVLSQECLGCICHAASLCNTTFGCHGDICGPFQMTWGYWSDGGKPTLNQESPDEPGVYGKCATDPYCSALAVQGYMQKYQQDCNNDGKISCDDFVALHKLGGYGCRGELPDWYRQRYNQCSEFAGTNLNL